MTVKRRRVPGGIVEIRPVPGKPGRVRHTLIEDRKPVAPGSRRQGTMTPSAKRYLEAELRWQAELKRKRRRRRLWPSKSLGRAN